MIGNTHAGVESSGSTPARLIRDEGAEEGGRRQNAAPRDAGMTFYPFRCSA